MTSKDSKKNNKNNLEETLITFSDVTEFNEETKSLPDWLKENPRRYSNQSATEVKLGFSPHRILNIDPDKEVKLEYRKKTSQYFLQFLIIQEIQVDIRATYSWYDDRLNFTGKGEAGIPAYNYKKSKTCQEEIIKSNNKKECLKWVYQRNPSRIWIPNFRYATASTEEESIWDKFVTIQNVLIQILK